MPPNVDSKGNLGIDVILEASPVHRNAAYPNNISALQNQNMYFSLRSLWCYKVGYNVFKNVPENFEE